MNDANFYKSHRSCLINIDNVRHIDFDNGVIFFDEKTTNLLSRANKAKLKKMLGISNA